jgi:hypothetical protein
MLLMHGTAMAQIESIQRQDSGVTAPLPQKRDVEPPLSASAPDTTGIWFHVRHDDLPRARDELERLRREHPGWQPPEELMAAVSGVAPTSAVVDVYGKNVGRAESAISTRGAQPKDFAAIAATIQARRDTNAGERMARAFLTANQPLLARPWFERAATWAKPNSKPHVAAVSGLINAECQAGAWQDAERHVKALAPGPARDGAARILADLATAAAQSAAKSGDWAGAEQLASIAESNGPSRVRTDLGWVALDGNDHSRAAALFATGQATEESRYGRILALSHPDSDLTALTSACAPQDRSERATTACGDAFAARTLTAYEAKDWSRVVDLDATVRMLGLPRNDVRLLAGWSHYRLGDNDRALQDFDAVAATEPSAADGIIQTLMASGRIDALAARAATGTPAFKAAYHKQVGELALIRKRIRTAAAIDVPGTEGIEGYSATVGIFTRDKTGASGADLISWKGASLSASVVADQQKWSIGVDTGYLHTGMPSPTAPIGLLLPSPIAADPGVALTMPWVQWETEGLDHAYAVTVGTTPIGGAVGALPAISASAERNWDSVIAKAILRAVPRYDSLLAMAGLRDGATGTTWGRVVEIGPEAGAILLLNQQWSLSGGVSIASLKGHNVADNTHVSANLSLTYEFKPDGFDYVRVGPAYGFEHYARNENFFTIGNGGYYSPAQAHSLGGFVDFLTTEGQTWQVGGRITAAWQHSVEESARRLPLTNDLSRFAGITQSQFGTDSVLRGSVLLSSRLIFGAYGRVTYSPSGRDMAAGMTLTVPFTARTAVFSSDLPHFADRSWP